MTDSPLKNILPIIPLIIISLLLTSCQRSDSPSAAPYTVTQIGTNHTLNAGEYHGILPISTLLNHGNFGLGTYDNLNGEMILLGGQFYQVLVDGTVVNPPLTTTTPFGVVTFFNPTQSIPINSPIDIRNLEQELLSSHIDPNRIYAIKITANLDSARYRSWPEQKPPFKPFSELSDQEKIYNSRNIDVTLVGFYFPEWFGEVNTIGFHFHFITNNHKTGGHLYDALISRGNVEISSIDQLLILDPLSQTTHHQPSPLPQATSN